MLQWISKIDRQWLLAINSHHTAFLDNLMWFASGTFSWIPLYAFLLVLLVKKYKKEGWMLIALMVPLVVISDQLASDLIKNLVQRPRPSHTPGLENYLHYVNNYRGGLYGFVSSHAMNTFSLCFYILFTVRSDIKWLHFLLFPWAIWVSYSRMYLGVHFPSDIIVPFFISIVLGYGMSRVFFFWKNYRQKRQKMTV